MLKFFKMLLVMFLLVPVTYKELKNQVNNLPIKLVKAGELVACIDFMKAML